MLKLAVFALLLASSRSERVCQNEAVMDATFAKILDTSTAQQSLKDHSAQVSPKEIIQVADNVWMAIGYGLANSVAIKGDDGFIVVDAMDSDTPAREVAPLFLDVTKNADGSTLPVTGIIYTHNHPDHISGAHVFAAHADPDKGLQVWSHTNLVKEFWDKWQYNRPILMSRGVRQVGSLLPVSAIINAGLGPSYVLGKESGLLLVPPTHVLEGDSQDITISGVNMKLIYIPGETRDQMGIYLPDSKLFICGDDYYHTFPNLYAIRGTPPRPVQSWMASIDLMIDLDIETLVPIHTRPVYGTDINERLTDYRDAIQFVNDQTMRYMNKGLHPQEVAKYVTLPEPLASKNYLLEHYGGVEWSVKTVYEGQMGWYSGLPEDLFPLTPAELGCRTIDLLGAGEDREESDGNKKKCNQLATGRARGRCYAMEEAAGVAAQADAETSEADLRYAMIVVSYAINCDTDGYIDGNTDLASFIQEAKAIRADVGIKLANRQSSPNGRNYLLSYIAEENCLGPTAGINPYANDFAPIMLLPYERIYNKLATLLRAEDLVNTRATVVIDNAHSGHTFTLNLRNSVLSIREGSSENPDLQLRLLNADGESYFRAMLARQLTVDTFLSLPVSSVEGNMALADFVNWFDDPNALPLLPYGV